MKHAKRLLTKIVNNFSWVIRHFLLILECMNISPCVQE